MARHRIYIARATFFGTILDRDGKPVNGPGALYPVTDLRVFEAGDFLFAMQNYHFDITNGEFCLDVLPTDFGVERPFWYDFCTPVKSWRLSLPGLGPHNFQEMLSRT